MTDEKGIAQTAQDLWARITADDAARSELIENLGNQDLAVVRLMVGRGMDPRRSARFALSEDGQVIVASGQAEDAQRIVNRIYELARQDQAVPVDFAPVEWKGGQIGRLVVSIDKRALSAPPDTKQRAEG